MVSIGIIGGGFSGLAALAALIRHAAQPLHITIYEPGAVPGRGKAYSTQDPAHLLNVRAGGMGAHEGQEGDFYIWLNAQNSDYQAADFAPRALYGRYLDQVLADTLVAAGAKDIRVFMAHEKVLDVLPAGDDLLVKTATLQQAHQSVILACGNDRPRMPALGSGVAQHAGWWKSPYQAERWRDIQKAGHIVIIGSGLSMIDALVTLKREKYDGDITAVSRHGHIPHAHAAVSVPFSWKAEEVQNIHTLSQFLYYVRVKAVSTGADWRDVLDGMRPYANDIWRGFSARERQRAQRYMSLWNNHRHRIPQTMHDMVSDFVITGQLRLSAARVDRVEAMGSSLNVHTAAGVREGQIVMNCLGYDYSIMPGDGSLLSALVKSGLAGVNENFLCPAHPSLQMHARHKIYGVGPLWQGYFIESTAVRDIRFQADIVAQGILEKL